MRDDVIDILTTMVAFDTTSSVSNLGLVDWLADRLDGPSSVVSRTFDDTGTKANLIARVGPEAPGGLVLCGHLDTVPANPDSWTSDPWTLTRRDADDGDVRLVGRGTADMKGFVALCIDLLRDVDPSRLRRPLWFALTYDEEVGTLGAPSAVADLVAHDADVEAVLIGEPTELRPVGAHKGIRTFRAHVTGQQGHSSRPDLGANALVAAARIATHIDDLAQELADGTVHEPFVPPHTTWNVALLRAGQAINIIPPTAELWFEYRPVPADDDDRLIELVQEHVDQVVLPALRATDPEATITIEATATSPALAPEPDGAALRWVNDLLGTDGEASAVSFATDGSHFQAAGLSTVVCGPGSIDVAHRPDEFITIGELTAGADMLAGIPSRLSSTA